MKMAIIGPSELAGAIQESQIILLINDVEVEDLLRVIGGDQRSGLAALLRGSEGARHNADPGVKACEAENTGSLGLAPNPMW